ncbi:hypothetical protein [Natronosalvus amylolyticus]|uniref:hypothetical protein n=1 Tax=Natronosalvus amylolyticus TaxID=2961994 RepID=UPI0020C9DC72|nr:hypothetical protein [Natronosalvus amylolyticus]
MTTNTKSSRATAKASASASTSSSSQSSSPYPRRNWWGEDVDGTDTDTNTETSEPQPVNYERERAAWIAHRILKETATLACPITLNEPPNNPAALWQWLEHGEADSGHDPSALHRANEVIELTDAEYWVPCEDSDDLANGYGPHPSRVNLEYGYIAGPQILDRPTAAFMSVVNALLDHFEWSPKVGLSSREREKLECHAERLKRNGDWRDTDVLAEIVYEATSEGAVLGGDDE